jgi:uncharacterized membrane-anchored protein
MKKLPLIMLCVLIAIQLALPFKMIRDKENILRNGELFKFKTRPIDPIDPFQGRYVRLGFKKDHILCNEDEIIGLSHKQPIYAFIKTDHDGFAYFSGWSYEQPASGVYLKTRYRWKYTVPEHGSSTRSFKGISIQIPFDRYYMDEAKAPRAERIARDTNQTSNCWVNVRILNGIAVIEEVFAEGQSLRDLATEKE